MNAKRTSITIHPLLYADAERVMIARHYQSFSEYIAALLRADVDAYRATVAAMGSTLAEDPVKYGARTKRTA